MNKYKKPGLAEGSRGRFRGVLFIKKAQAKTQLLGNYCVLAVSFISEQNPLSFFLWRPVGRSALLLSFGPGFGLCFNIKLCQSALRLLYFYKAY